MAAEEFDGMLDKIIEMDVWRGTVKDLQMEEEAILLLVQDWVDTYTGEFFIDHFTEIKGEYLRNFKEQMSRIET